MKYREIDDMYYVGDIVDIDWDGWVDKETFQLICFELLELIKLIIILHNTKNKYHYDRP